MGVYADFITHTTVMDKTEPQVAIDRVAYNELLRQQNTLDPTAPAAYDAADEVQSIAVFGGTFTGGNYTLTLTPPVDAAVTTANIAYNANAATIEGAVNTVCTGNITGWTNGDISVTGGDLTGSPVVLTFDGTSVDNLNFEATVIADVDLTDGSANSANTITTNQGTIVLTADAVGTEFNGEVFTLADVGSLAVTYDDVNTFTVNYNGGTTNHTQVETAIDDAMTANPTWPQFECSVTNGGLPVDAVDDTLSVTTAGGLDVGTLGAVSTVTAGQPQRYSWGVMWALGLISVTDLPIYGDALATDVALWAQPSENPQYPSAALRGVIAEQAAIDDDNATLLTQLKALFKIQ